jgi:hypothetical protein
VSAASKLTAFAVLLAGLFGIGLIAGGVFDAGAPGDESAAHGASGMSAMEDEHGGGHAEMAADPIRGLAVAEHGLRLVLEEPERSQGVNEQLRFRILADDGSTVRSFDVEHTKRMHLIVVRRDLTQFQHLHPKMAADGTWSVPLALAQPGSYRVFADFSHGGEPTTLGGDLRVDGDADLQPLPPPAPRAAADGGYLVRMQSGRAHPGAPAELNFEIIKDGRPAAVQTYLGAGGHLVALREGDLAFLHVHPEEHGGAAAAGEIGFAATFPTAGSYRLFLQFKVDDRVRTVAFTKEVG